ncbi:MAG: tetratricopeptide repeat protein [Syntrophaceae bacterium]
MEKNDRKGGYGMVSLSEVVDRKEFIARAEACLEQDPAQAVDLALERLRVYPDDVEAKIILGIGWYRKGEKAPALDVLRGLIDDVIRWSPAFSVLSELCRERGLDEEAERATRIYMSMNPESPEAIADLEDRLRRESRTYPEPGAEKSDEEVGLPRAADFKTLTLADLYARQGYRELAEALLKEILASDPQNREALDRLAKLRPQVREEVHAAAAGEGVPDGGRGDLFFGEPVAPPFQGLFSRTVGAGLLEPDEPAPDAAAADGKEPAVPERRERVVGALNRWLVSLDRMKGNA